MGLTLSVVCGVGGGAGCTGKREMAGHAGTDKAWVLWVLTASDPSLFARAPSPFIGLVFCKQGLTL